MSRRTVRQFVVDQLAKAVPAVDVQSTLPKGAPMGDMAVIIRMLSKEKRTSMPRAGVGTGPGGLKEIKHTLSVWICTVDADEVAAQLRHDDVIQGVLTTLRTAPLDFVVTDTTAQPNETSLIKLIGEDIDISENRAELLESFSGAEQDVGVFSIMMTQVTETVHA